MSQRFQAPFAGDPFECFAAMYAANPAPFFAYINAGDHQIVSTSPERFIRLQNGSPNTMDDRVCKGRAGPRRNTGLRIPPHRGRTWPSRLGMGARRGTWRSPRSPVGGSNPGSTQS